MNPDELQVHLDAHMAALHKGIAARFQALAEQLDARSRELHLGIAARFEAQAAQLDARTRDLAARLEAVSAPGDRSGSSSIAEVLSRVTETEIDRLDSYLVHHVDELKSSLVQLESKLDSLRGLVAQKPQEDSDGSGPTE